MQVRRLMALFRDLDARQGSLPKPAPRGLPLPKRPAEAQLPRPAKAARHTGPAAAAQRSTAPPPGSLIQPPSHSRGLSAAQGGLPLPLPMPLQRPLDFSDEFEEPEQPGRPPPAFLPVPPLGLRPRQPSPSSYSPHVPELPPCEPYGSPGRYPGAFSPQPFSDPGLLLPQPGPSQQHQRGQQHTQKLSQKQQVKQQRQAAKQQAKTAKQQAKAAKQQKGKAGKLPPKPGHERGQAGPRAVPKAACSILLHDVPQGMSADALVALLDGPGGSRGQYDLLRVYPSVKGLPSQSAVVHFREAGQAAALWERLCSSTWTELGAPPPAAEAGEKPHVWVLSTDTLGSLRASTQLRKRETIEYEGSPSGYSLPSDVTCVFYMPGTLPVPAAHPVLASASVSVSVPEEGELPAARHEPIVFRASPEKDGDGVGVGGQQEASQNGGHASPQEQQQEQAELLRQQRELEQQQAAAAAYDQELDALLSEGAAAVAQPEGLPAGSRVVSGSSNGFTVTVRGSPPPRGASAAPVQLSSAPQFGDDFLAQ